MPAKAGIQNFLVFPALPKQANHLESLGLLKNVLNGLNDLNVLNCHKALEVSQ
jgi:hypothetical protein